MLTELERQHEAHKAIRQRLMTAPRVIPIMQEEPEPQPVPIMSNVVQLDVPVVRPYAVFQKYPSLNDIMSEICRYYRVRKIDMISERRTWDITGPRQIYYFLAREMTTKSFPEISRTCGGRDHTTSLHGERKVRMKLEFDQNLRDDIDLIRLRIADLLAKRNAITGPVIAYIGA